MAFTDMVSIQNLLNVTHAHTSGFIDSSNSPHISEYKMCHYQYNVSTFMFLLISTGQKKGQIVAQD